MSQTKDDNSTELADQLVETSEAGDKQLGNTLDEKSIESSVLEQSTLDAPHGDGLIKELISGEYEGEYLNGRFHGKGYYTHNGRRYEGSFMDGMFHGQGTLTILKSQVSYQGFWQKGKFVDGELVFADGLSCPIDVDALKTNNPEASVRKEWNYCSAANPLFHRELLEGKRAPYYPSSHGHSLPAGCYDTIDGYYHPGKHLVFSFESNEPIRTPSPEEIDYILKNFRVGK